MPDYPPAYILVGPTASGKSAVAQRIAEQTGASVISADSMNIYRGMNIGTAKPSLEERETIDYYGVDLASPSESFSVGDWLAAIRPAFQQRGQSRNLVKKNDEITGLTPPAGGGLAFPIVAGGTGLYVKCLLQGLDDLPPADEALRARTEKMTLAELQAEAKHVAPEAYSALADNQNPRRLIRLLEKSASRNTGASNHWKRELPVVIGLHVERDVLHKRIAERVEKMYAGGLLDEARELLGLELSATARHAIGYAEAFAVLRGEMNEAEAKEKTIVRTRQLSKRQMTWFRHQLNVEWIHTADFPDLGSLAEKVSTVWKNRGPVPLAGVCV